MREVAGRVLFGSLVLALAAAAGCAQGPRPARAAAPSGTPPRITRVATPAKPVTGRVAIGFTLVDADSDLCRIRAELSRDGGATWRPAREGPGSTSVLAGSPAGVEGTLVWDAALDLPENASDVRVRLVPEDRAVGAGAETGPFVLLGDPRDPAIDWDAASGWPVVTVEVLGHGAEASGVGLRTRIEADGRVVCYDERRAIHGNGRLAREEIAALLLFAKERGFQDMVDARPDGPVAASVPTQRIRIRTRLGERTVSASAAAPPPGFFEIFRRFTGPRVVPPAPPPGGADRLAARAPALSPGA